MAKTTNNVVNGATTVFLGGTCNESTWREELLPMLCAQVSAFNPVVDDWNEEAQANEDWHKAHDDFCLYVLTPEMAGFYSIFEVADDSNKRPARTICCFLRERAGLEFDAKVWRGVEKIKRDLVRNGAMVCDDLKGVAEFLNNVVRARAKTQP